MKYLHESLLEVVIYLLFQENKLNLNLLKGIDRYVLIQSLLESEINPFFAISLNKISEDTIDKWVVDEIKKVGFLDRIKVAPVPQDAVDKIKKIAQIKMEDTKQLLSKSLQLQTTIMPNHEKKLIFESLFWMYSISIKNKNGLAEFLKSYLQAFENNELDSFDNVYSYEAHLQWVPNLFEINVKNYGNTFTTNKTLPNLDCSYRDEEATLPPRTGFYKQDIANCLKLYELLLVFEEKRFISINSCRFTLHPPSTPSNDIPKTTLDVKITLKKQPNEIYDITQYWSFYGDIRINETDGVARYKKNVYPYRLTTGKEFKLLCHLVKSHGKKMNINKTYDIIYTEPEDLLKTNKKELISDCVKRIREHLGILDDANPSTDIMIIGENVFLTSNPPTN